jgi:hypothetical protein
MLSAGTPRISVVSRVSSNSNVPNGLKATIDFQAHYKSAGIATVGYNDWIVHVVSISKELDISSQQARLDKILEAIRPESLQNSYPPLTEIPQCGPEVPVIPFFPAAQEAVKEAGSQTSVVGGLVATVAAQHAELKDPDAIGNRPDHFCWSASTSGKTRWFRPIDEPKLVNWINAMGIFGWTVEAWSVPPVQGEQAPKFVLISNDFESSIVSGFYHSIPNPAAETINGMMSVLQKETAVYVTRENVLVLPKDTLDDEKSN